LFSYSRLQLPILAFIYPNRLFNLSVYVFGLRAIYRHAWFDCDLGDARVVGIFFGVYAEHSALVLEHHWLVQVGLLVSKNFSFECFYPSFALLDNIYFDLAILDLSLFRLA
jgi:hypothetical protein